MIREPWFWRSPTKTARALSAALAPAAALYDAAQQLRARTASPAQFNRPIICVGNATLGGAGKTPFAIELSRLLRTQLALAPWFLTRGYGGAEKGPVIADPERHTAFDIGDEALLLAAAGKTMVARNRAAGARAAFDAGAPALIMDDGFQNPTIAKTASILLVDGAAARGNGRVFPAGPMREPLARAAERADLIVNVAQGGEPLADCNARTIVTQAPAPGRAIAFCAIARPSKFFTTLDSLGFERVQSLALPDHQPYTDAMLDRLRRAAKAKDALLVTTDKDFVRMTADQRSGVETVSIEMRLDDEAGFLARLRTLLNQDAPQ